MDNRIKDKHVLFVVENNSVPFDTRVWNEAKSIRKICNNVSVLCPKPKDEKRKFKTIDNINIYMYPNPIQGSGAKGLILEYILSYFFISICAFYIYVKKPFHIVHIANPPDFLLIIFLIYKSLGTKIIFDHHDPTPEVYYSKFHRKGVFYNLMLFFERLAYKLADKIITVNESCRALTSFRNEKRSEEIAVVRNCPDIPDIESIISKNGEKRDYRLVGYVGVIDKQDNVDKLVYAMEYIVKEIRRQDIKMLIIGDGTDLNRVKSLVEEKGLSQYFIFNGAEYNKIRLYKLLSQVDICVDPQEYNEQSKIISAIKIMEYMALGKPIVQYNVGEGKIIAAEASKYVYNNDERSFAKTIVALLDNPNEMTYMGNVGKTRINRIFRWDVQEKKLIDLYNEIFNVYNIN